MSDTVAAVGGANAPRLAGAAAGGEVAAAALSSSSRGSSWFWCGTLFSEYSEHAAKVGGQVEAATGNPVLGGVYAAVTANVVLGVTKGITGHKKMINSACFQ